jgi:hypothetical protein
MTDQVSMNGSVSVVVEPARGRQTPDNSFGAVLERGSLKVASAVLGSAQAAASVVPGGGLVSAVAAGLAGAAGLECGNSDKWALLKAQEQLQDEGLSNSLRLLALQKKMQEETELVNTVSNLLKSRHEMAKAAISNLR